MADKVFSPLIKEAWLELAADWLRLVDGRATGGAATKRVNRNRVMPHTADQYRRAAEEARQLAAKATDSCERVQLLRLAAQWQRLADYKARLESKPSPQSK